MKTCPACQKRNSDEALTCISCGFSFQPSIKPTEPDSSYSKTSGFSPGDRIADRYEVVKVLGRGGMGVVYLVKDTLLQNRQEALKMIHPQLVENPHARQRFEQEVGICLDLLHPNIVRVHDLKEWQGQPYFTMEYVSGRSLRQLINDRKDKKPPFSLTEASSIINPLLDALSYAHEFTVHRDVKPENIIITGEFPNPSIKVLDFGIAKTLSPSRFSMTSQMLGTPYYVAPEQRSGGKVDHRADLYAVGQILYELFTGEIADVLPEMPSQLYPELPAEVDRIIARLLKKEPSQRYSSAGEVKAGLEKALSMQAEYLKKRQADEAKRRQEEEIRELLSQAQSAMGDRQWERAERLCQRVVGLSPGHPGAAELAKKAAAARETLAKLEKELEQAEASGDLPRALELCDSLSGLVENAAKIEDRKTRIQDQLQERQRQEEESRRRQEAEAVRLREEEEKRKATEKRQADEAKRRQEEEIKELLSQAQSAMGDRQWERAERLCQRVVGLSPGHPGAAELTKKAAAAKETLAKLEKELKQAESSGDLPRALELCDSLSGLVGGAAKIEGRKTRIQDQLRERQRQEEESRRRQEAEAVRLREEEEKRKAEEKRLKEEKETARRPEAGKRHGYLFVGLAAVLIVVGLLVYWQASERPPSRPEQPPQKVEVKPEPPPTVAPKPEATTQLVDGPLPGMKFAYIPPGTFMMGSPADEKGRDSDETQHQVTLTRAFYLMTTEVTVGHFKQFVQESGYRTEAETGGGAYVWTGKEWQIQAGTYWGNPGFSQSDSHPVTCVSWNDAQAFIKWLNGKAGGNRYRLPTEAEWEYAARARIQTSRFWGDNADSACRYANVADRNAKKKYQDWVIHECDDGYAETAPVAKYEKNAFGLYDMIGNVLEWCSDWYGNYPAGAVTDPTGPSSGALRVLRGGGWVDYARYCRSANRSGGAPGGRSGYNVGFRLAGQF